MYCSKSSSVKNLENFPQSICAVLPWENLAALLACWFCPLGSQPGRASESWGLGGNISTW